MLFYIARRGLLTFARNRAAKPYPRCKEFGKKLAGPRRACYTTRKRYAKSKQTLEVTISRGGPEGETALSRGVVV